MFSSGQGCVFKDQGKAAEVFDALTIWQSLAALEVVHCIAGLVRAGLFTTFLQVFSRYVVVWCVLWVYPATQITAQCWWMVVAWTVTEVSCPYHNERHPSASRVLPPGFSCVKRDPVSKHAVSDRSTGGIPESTPTLKCQVAASRPPPYFPSRHHFCLPTGRAILVVRSEGRDRVGALLSYLVPVLILLCTLTTFA